MKTIPRFVVTWKQYFGTPRNLKEQVKTKEFQYLSDATEFLNRKPSEAQAKLETYKVPKIELILDTEEEMRPLGDLWWKMNDALIARDTVLVAALAIVIQGEAERLGGLLIVSANLEVK